MNDDIKSLREVVSKTLEAMGRMSKRLKVLEALNQGMNERIENVEKAFREAFTKAQENLVQFLDKASTEDEDKVESEDKLEGESEKNVTVVG